MRPIFKPFTMNNTFRSIRVFAFVAAITFTRAHAQQSPAKFADSIYAFGTIPQGKPVTAVFAFKNISGKPLIIESATAGCGCTTPEFPKAAVANQGKASITVTYNAQAPGSFTKLVTVKFAGIDRTATLTITGEVK